MTDNRNNTVTPYDVIVMWVATSLLRKDMGGEITMGSLANHLLRELDEHGFIIVPKEPR